MPILGSAIATHLSRLKGLYSVELPVSLADEMEDVVRDCNKTSASRALLVSDEPSSQDVRTISWAEILGWRTDDDRVFVWRRGSQEPDTSFRSVVRPFISARFPGAIGGECTLDQLARLSVVELWRRRGFASVGDAFDAFLATARWVAGVLGYSFELVGSTPSVHWSDMFLKHWAEMLKQLDDGLASLGSAPYSRHAWEIVRLGGLIVPSRIAKAGNPFLSPPEELPEQDWPSFAKVWQEIVEEFILPEGAIALLLAALDKSVTGAGTTTAWRGLDWTNASTFPPEAPAPEVGRAVFAAKSSPSMLSAQSPTYPTAPIPSWWGVTSAEIEGAADILKGSKPLQPDPSCSVLAPAWPDDSQYYVLRTRAGTLSQAHTARTWKAEVLVNDLVLLFREDWRRLSISPFVPTGTFEDGEAWINPDSVVLESKGKGLILSAKQVFNTAGDQLAVRCNATVEYASAKDTSSGTMTGKWEPFRSLKLKATIRNHINGAWGPVRDIESSIVLVVPSPFGATVFVKQGKKALVAPDNGDDFSASLSTPGNWKAESTPDILLEKEGICKISIAEAGILPEPTQFAPITVPTIKEGSLAQGSVAELFSWMGEIDDGDTIAGSGPDGYYDIAVFRIRERSGNLSSGLLSAVRGLPAGRRPPSNQSRSTLLGQYQLHVGHSLSVASSGTHNSLYQYVASSTDVLEKWPGHTGTPSPIILSKIPPESLLGIGSGPSSALVSCAEWTHFMATLGKVCQAIGLGPNSTEFWLSGFDPTVVGGPLVRDFVASHRDMLRAARQISSQDRFWASYPFSVIIVDGSPGASLGQLLAVLLSPLHPARLAWAFAVAVTAREGDIDPSLLGLAEGWNIPYTGNALNPAGQEIPMIAIPTDPGPEQDFATWSALAVLNTTGLASVPAFAAGLPLPWGGQTGMNDKVVERAITDYLYVHPHVSSLQVDIRSVSPAPRSREVDGAVLRFVGSGSLLALRVLGGGTRVWDSSYRLGSPPTRDWLFALRAEKDVSGPFEWRRYTPPEVPSNADVAFIENSSVHLAINVGVVNGVLSPLPLRRFCPPALKNLMLDQNYSAQAGDDVLGLSELLAELENSKGSYASLRATPQVNALGIGMGARWEVLGTSNLDPSLLSSVVATKAQGAGSRLLWEWRPSWLSQSEQGDLASRPYYVIATIPPSLLKGLEYLYGFSADHANQMVSRLGQRGIGLASLQAAGGTQASAAAGFFYALSLVLPSPEYGLAAQWISTSNDTAIYGLVPIDPLESILEGIAGKRLRHRADLLVVRIVRSTNDATRVCFLPVEVKHHGRPGDPEAIPANSDKELNRARSQLGETAEVLEALAGAIHPIPGEPKSVIGSCARRVGLATILDLAMSFAPAPPAPNARADILRDVGDDRVAVGVGHPVLFWFAPGSIALNGSACVVDPYGTTMQNGRVVRELFIDPSAIAALWWTSEPIGPNETQVRRAVDEVLSSALSECSLMVAPPGGELRPDLMEILGLSGQPIPQQSAGVLPSKEKRPGNDGVSDLALADRFSCGSVGEGQALGPGPTIQSSEQDAMKQSDSGERDEQGQYLGEHQRTPLPPAEEHDLVVPRAFVGWTGPTPRWALMGKLDGSAEPVAIDLDHPKALGIFGYMGSGKSYLLGTLIEGALEPIPLINVLKNPLAVVIFNYRRNASDRFELNSLAVPNHDMSDIQRLALEFRATPQLIRDLRILCLPGELTGERIAEYGQIPASELFFNPNMLSVEDWELLMGEPGSEAVFARTIRHALIELRSGSGVTLESLEQYVVHKLTGRSRSAAQLRFDFVRRYLSAERGVDLRQILRPGRAVIVDLRQPLLNKADALRFFLICSNQVSQVQGMFNKLVVFDEAHEYLSDEFGEKLDARVRQMRHEGTSYIFATQDVESIPQAVRRFITTRFVFSLGTRENVDDLLRLAPEFRGQELLGMKPGYCLVQANQSIAEFFKRPRLMHVRPRVTEHGGASRIFSSPFAGKDGEDSRENSR
jgi:hypothetical protein